MQHSTKAASGRAWMKPMPLAPKTTELVKVPGTGPQQAVSASQAKSWRRRWAFLNQVLPVLTEGYQQENQDLIRAVSSIRRVQGSHYPRLARPEGRNLCRHRGKV